MVFRKVVVFLSGVGIASMPIHWEIHESQRKEKQDIENEFKRQREILYTLKINKLT
jgi:hypothetical protein